MTERLHFWGKVGTVSTTSGRRYVAHNSANTWRYEADNFSISVRGKQPATVAAWQDSANRSTSPFVLAMGSFFLGSDGDYGESTSVAPLAIESAPQTIAHSFEIHGTRAFALLDGDFSVVLYEPKSRTAYLVVDKLGCSDICFRREGNSILFASEPSDLIYDDETFDPLPVAFLLAHEGFIPAPFTLSTNVMSIGRSRFARISLSEGKQRCDIETYWSPDANWDLPNPAASRDKLFSLLNDAVGVRVGRRSSLLISGGIDSSLVMNLVAPRLDGDLLALTGSIKGWDQGEQEVAHARRIAEEFGVPHESVILDPQDETLPEESFHCNASWMNGIRLSLPLWRRFALCLRERLGEGYNVLAGQTADTLADNNYTLTSAGYTFRRAFFSSWFMRTLPVWKAVLPRANGTLGRATIGLANSLSGPRMAGMMESILHGMSGRENFYAGRLFGYGEMPGISRNYFPMLNGKGFDRIVDWYCSNFVRPLSQNLNSRNFYREMIQMSMDMNMLHLDSRLLFHIYRQEGGRAQLPFMDARVVTFFSSLPYGARAIYREPKHVIRCQLRRPGMRYQPKPAANGISCESKCQEQLLLEGTLGAYYRSLLRQPTLLDRAPGLFEFVDERHFSEQLSAFHKGKGKIDYRFLAKIGTLEVWSRALASRRRDQPALVAQ
jgi:hypothetical protein